MSGMTTTGAASLSGYNNRTIAIAVSGLCHPETSRTSNYVIKVPYSRLSATMQSIGRSGAKIVSVTLDGQATSSQTNRIEPATSPGSANPVAASPAAASPASPSPTVASPAAQPVAHGHGFQVDSDPKKSKKRKR